MREMKRVGNVARIAFVMSAVALVGAGCGAEASGETSVDDIRVSSSFTSKGTGYFPDSSALEGGFNDRIGKPLHTLQSYLAGSAPYVSVAMDTAAFKYGTRLRIHELEEEHGREIVFRVVDTGGAFRGKGRTRMDICTANSKASLDPTINGTLHVDVVNESEATALPPVAESAPASPTPSTGATCSFDGACNPGNNGAGMICTNGHCVKGCHRSNQCAGSQTCNAKGQCE